MRLLLAVLPAIAACAAPYPENPLSPAPEGYPVAKQRIIAAWEDEVGQLGDPPLIFWFAGTCLNYGDGFDPCTKGAYWQEGDGQTEIHLVVTPNPADSSLAHELLHWALDETGDDDPDHTDPLWERVPEVSRAAWALDGDAEEPLGQNEVNGVVHPATSGAAVAGGVAPSRVPAEAVE